MRRNSTQGKEMLSLNRQLFDEFGIEELEDRLETDPLMFSQIFGEILNEDTEFSCVCRNLKSCPKLGCLVDSCPELS